MNNFSRQTERFEHTTHHSQNAQQTLCAFRHLSLSSRLHALTTLVAALLSLVFWTGTAQARPGDNGFKVGLARLHPGIGLSLRYDSYAVQVSRTEKAGDLILKVRPGVDLELKGAHIDFDMYARASYSRYLGISAPASSDASFVGVEAGLSLTGKISETFTMTLSDDLVRSDSSQAPTLQVGVLSLHNDAGLKLAWRPWKGTLHIEPSYHLASEVFTKRTDFDNLTCADGFGCTGWDVSESNYLNHKAAVDLRWDFFPKSSLLFNLSYRARQYLGDNGVNLQTIDASVGISTAIFPRLTIGGAFGWSQELSNVYSSPNARANVSYALASQSKISLYYQRAVNPTPGLTWVAYSSDTVGLGADFLFAGRVMLNAGVSANFINYKSKDSETKDTFELKAQLTGTYQILKWLHAGLTYQLTYDDRLAGIKDFTRHDVILFAELRY